MEDFDVKKEVKVSEETFKPAEEAEETITDTEETPEEKIEEPKEEPKQETNEPTKVSITIPLVFAFVLGVCATLIFFNFYPQGITEEDMQFKIVESNVNTIMGYTNSLCETANVTVFEMNNPEAIPFMTSNGNNISAKSMNVNDACDIYQANKEAQA